MMVRTFRVLCQTSIRANSLCIVPRGRRSLLHSPALRHWTQEPRTRFPWRARSYLIDRMIAENRGDVGIFHTFNSEDRRQPNYRGVR